MKKFFLKFRTLALTALCALSGNAAFAKNPSDLGSAVDDLTSTFSGAKTAVVGLAMLVLGYFDIVFLIEAVKAYSSKDPNASSAFIKLGVAVVVSIGAIIAIQRIFFD